MILRYSSSVERAALVLVALVLAAALAYSSIRNARAVHYAGQETLQGYEKAARLEPGNARNWYLLGRYWQYNLEQPDTQRAIRAYQNALSFDSKSADTWLDLGTAYEAEGDLSAARDAFLHAKRAYPLSAEVSWRYGNFLLRQGELPPAFAEIRRAVEVDPQRSAEALSRCLRVNPDINAILDKVLPPFRDVYVDVIWNLTNDGQFDQALVVWSRLAALHPQLPLREVFPLVNGLIQRRRLPEAQRVWAEAVQFSGLPPLPEFPGSVVWDGGFEAGVADGGFGWRFEPFAQGVRTSFDDQEKHSGKHSLRLVFDGKSNVSFQNACTFAAVRPSTSYRFSAWVRTRALTTDQGVRFGLHSPEILGAAPVLTPDIRGSEPWTRVEMPWLAGKDVHQVQICVSRFPSAKLDNKIQGTAWVDDVALVPEFPETGKP
jgi:tetratricopeptide (TPR) repeat protein